MDVREVRQLADDLVGFTADVFGSLTRAGWQDRAGWYLQNSPLAKWHLTPHVEVSAIGDKVTGVGGIFIRRSQHRQP